MGHVGFCFLGGFGFARLGYLGPPYPCRLLFSAEAVALFRILRSMFQSACLKYLSDWIAILSPALATADGLGVDKGPQLGLELSNLGNVELDPRTISD